MSIYMGSLRMLMLLTCWAKHQVDFFFLLPLTAEAFCSSSYFSFLLFLPPPKLTSIPPKFRYMGGSETHNNPSSNNISIGSIYTKSLYVYIFKDPTHEPCPRSY